MTIQQAFELGLQHHQSGRLAEAEAIYRRILDVETRHADALHLLGVIAHQVGRNDAAVDLIRQAIAIAPDSSAYHSDLGVAYHAAGVVDQAIAEYRQAVAFRPDFPEAHSNLGSALQANGQLDEAIAAYRRAIVLKPSSPEAHFNLGIILQVKGQLEEAIAAYRQAITLKPDYPEAHGNLATALYYNGQVEEAIAVFRQAIELKPDYPEAHFNLGTALQAKWQVEGAVAAYRQAITLNPHLSDALNNLGNMLKEQARFDEAMESYRNAMALKPEDALLHSNLIYLTLFHPGYTAHALQEESARWQQKHALPLVRHIQPHGNTPEPERRLKVGYVSPDFRHHVIYHFLLPLLDAHDHARFEIHCYSSVKRPDEITERMRKSADVWRDVLGMQDEALAELIRKDGIDILVDLTQHMANNRLPVFARKPAPLQVAWLGYPGSTGLGAIDYRFTDAFMEPEGAAWVESVEDPVRLPDSWFCFDPIDEYPATGPLPALGTGYVTFGCLNNFCKVNDAVLERWSKVLQAVDGSRLLLRCPEGGTQARVRAFFEARGIRAERVELVSWIPTRMEFLGLLQRIDIALDPFPYNGGTTTCEALWMGVPVLTLPGALVVSRIGLSILSAAGLPEFVAESESEYLSLAASLAGDLPRLAQIRTTLRQRMKASAFMDAARFARNVERAYREMWCKWCAQQA